MFSKWIWYLFLYDFMFIVSLVVIFMCTYTGISFARLTSWSKQNVILGKILMALLFLLLKNHTDEFKDIEYGPFSAIPGVRESRRIVCDKTITLEDLRSGKKFEDGMFTVSQKIDIHRRDKQEKAIYLEKVEPYHIPYGALLPKGLDNILVIGRCISGDHESLASYRMIADCMAMGEGAAIASKLAIQGNCAPRNIQVGKLLKEMSLRGYLQ